MSLEGAAADRRISSLLQQAADRLRGDMPDRLHLSFKDDEVWYRCRTWSATLTRQDQTGRFGVYDPDLNAGYHTASLLREDVASQMVESILGWRIRTEIDRDTVASTLGLIHDDLRDDLPPSRMAIDKLLLTMVDRSGWDIRAAAARASSTKHGWFGGRADMIFVQTGFGETFAIQEDLLRPVIRVWHPLGSARYDGNLFIPQLIPETVVERLVGCRVGELVSTGVAALDSRRITKVSVTREKLYGLDPWPPDPGTWVTIEPDLVELGPGTR